MPSQTAGMPTPDRGSNTDDAHPSDHEADDQPPRLVVDPGTGQTWSVRLASWQWPPTGPPSACLIFDRGDLVRRVWPVPDHWRHMHDTALLSLVERRPSHERA